jgi:Glycosyl hydrolase family 26
LSSSLGSRLRPHLGSHLLIPGAAFLLASVAFVGAGIRFTIEPSSPPPAHASLPPSPASYLGVYETGAPPDYHPIAGFGKAAGKLPNMVGYYSGWAEPFAAKFARQAHAHGAIPYVQIDPTLASVSKIATGAYDIYLRTYADSVRKFGHAVVIGFGHEMNAPWYSWGYGHVPPATFIAAWRHIVTLFRGQGADNVTWLWTVNQDRVGTGAVAAWWPGAAYVTWVGIDGYYFRPSDTFASVFGRTIGQVRIFTDKPILLSETSVSPRAGQFVKINNLFAGMRQYETLGLVWFDIAQRGSFRGQDWRIEGDAPAEAAFQLGISELTLARP